MEELVSIIMPNYNGAAYLDKTIQSVLSQTYTNWELIFVDDCSTDNSLEIVKTFQDERIRVFKNKSNSGAAASRNYALREAKGKWIAFLDSDDIWEIEKLAKQIAFMVNNSYSFSFTDYIVIDKDDNILTLYKPKKDSCDYKDILKHCCIGCSTVIYDKATLGVVLMPETAIKREDFACWLAILKTGEKAYCLHESLTRYKVHTDSVSSKKTKMIKYQWNVYRKVEGLSFVKAGYYMVHWAIRGVLKYR